MVESFLATGKDFSSSESSRLIWLGDGVSEVVRKSKTGKEEFVLSCYAAGKFKEIITDQKQTRFVFALIEKAKPSNEPFTFKEAEDLFREITGPTSEKMLKSAVWKGLIKMALVGRPGWRLMRRDAVHIARDHDPLGGSRYLHWSHLFVRTMGNRGG